MKIFKLFIRSFGRFSLQKIVIGFILFLSAFTAKSSDTCFHWFPKTKIFPLLSYDLLETQPYSGIFYLKARTVDYEGAYIPVNLGFQKSMLQWRMLNMNFELSLGAASYTQFEIIRYDANTLLGGLLNTDFKASGFLYASKNNQRFRLQLFHVSSHLGDDYMLRNQYFELNNKKVNYEQADFTYLYKTEHTDYYVSVGEVITPYAFRKRFMLEFGIQYLYNLNKNFDLSIGSDIKLYQENQFDPDIHSGIGISVKQNAERAVDFLIDNYFGKLPYSTLNFGTIYWIGISTRIYL